MNELDRRDDPTFDESLPGSYDDAEYRVKQFTIGRLQACRTRSVTLEKWPNIFFITDKGFITNIYIHVD